MRDPALIQPERLGIEHFPAPVAQGEADRARVRRFRAHDDEGRVVHLHGDPHRPHLEIVARRVDPEVRVEVPQDAGMGDLDPLVAPRALPIDAEGAGEAALRGGAGGGRRRLRHPAPPGSSKATLAKVTAPSGSGHCS